MYFFNFIIFLYIGLNPAEATSYDIFTKLEIPSIDLSSDVAKITLNDHQLTTPDYVVGSFNRVANKILLIGHSSTVFKNLYKLDINDSVIYDNTEYYVSSIKVISKNNVNMNKLLSDTDKKTIVMMTCFGQDLKNQDATHRLIITAEAE